MDTTIESVSGQEVLDSRGNPTVEVEVVLEMEPGDAPLSHQEHVGVQG
jgi:enolase